MHSVGKVYETVRHERIEAVSDVDLEIMPGEFVSLVGPSGCGKSTLLAMIGGLIPTTSGSVAVDGKVIDGPSPERGVVFQESSVFPWRRALDNVLFGLQLRGETAKTREATAREYLDLVGLSGFESYYPKELSGGMRQRLAIAQTLACHPRVLLMDEPFGALDAFTRERLQHVLVDIWQREGQTVCFVTHSVDEAVFLSDRVVVMATHPGRVSEIIDVPLPRPRDHDARLAPEFARTRSRIWELIEK